jgi:hypothetical protein
MFKKLIILIVMFSCVTAQGVIIHRYSFNDGDALAYDTVGGKDGTLEGTATISGNRLVLDGSGAAAWLPSDTLDTGLDSVTIECWVEVGTAATWARAWDFGGTSGSDGGNTIYFVANSGSNNTQFTVSTTGFPSWQTGEESVTSDGLVEGVMTHVACVFDGAGPEMRMYIDGELAASRTTTMDLSAVARENAYIGDSSYTGDPGLNGSVDEFRIYDTALMDSEILDSFNAGPDAEIGKITKASKPVPLNGQDEVPREVVLKWRGGDYADTHNVYFGTDEALVAAGDASVLIGDGQTDTFLDVGVLPYGGTYFWRVDEVNAAPDLTVYEGNVWSFTIEAYGYPIPAASIIAKASSQQDENQGPENTKNGSGLTDGMHSTDSFDMFLTAEGDPNAPWIQYDFDKPYKLVEMLVWNYNGPFIMSGFGMKDVVVEYSIDDVNWIVLDSITELAEATGTEDYTGESFPLDIAAKSVRISPTSAHGGDLFTQYGLAEVIFKYSPVRASNPVPESGTALEDTNVTLGWKAGRSVDEHHVYISTDEQAVVGLTAPATVVTDTELDAILSLGNTYYWTVVEVNNNNTPAEWPGDVWNLSTPEYFVLDDFEDGLAWEASGGATVADSNVVAHSGDKSMELSFNNDIPDGYSEARLIYSTDVWGNGVSLTKGDPTALVLWVYGDLGNVQTEQLYVRISYKSEEWQSWFPWFAWPIEQSSIYKNVAPTSELATPWWTQITIPVDNAVDWSKIMSINIGLMRSALTSGSGTLYIDDVRLYGTPPAVVTPSDPGTDNLVAYYAMENNVDDSSASGIHGTALGEPNFVAGPFGNYGNALECDGSDDLVDLGPADPSFNFTGSFSFSVWANIQNWGNEWGHAMVAARGEGGEGFQIRRGGGWVGGMQGYPNTGFCFSTRGIFLASEAAGGDDMMVGEPAFNTWTHIACVYDHESQVKSIYFDGELIRASATTAESVLSPASQNASIGARANGDNTGFEALFNGMLDEVKIYDDALTAGEARFLADPTP